MFSSSAIRCTCDLRSDSNRCYDSLLSFEAIVAIHSYLDGDKNGEVDSSEAAKFVRDEFTPAERAQQSRTLPRDDPYVSLSDLWSMWQSNPAFNWTVKQTIRWLIDYVDLPQYESIFRRYSLTGKALPLLAMSNTSFLTDVLMIRNPIHKKKIMVKALDVILFGPPQKPSILTTETSLITASCSLMVIALLGFLHWVYFILFGKTNLEEHENSILATEHALKDFQSRLDDLERLRFSLNDCEPNSSNATSLNTAGKQRLVDPPGLRGLLRLSELNRKPPLRPNSGPSAENEVGIDERMRNPDLHVSGYPDEGSVETASLWFASDSETIRNLSEMDTLQNFPSTPSVLGFSTAQNELALWLQLTYELEMLQYNARKVDAENHLKSIRQACKRLHRKRYTILGSMRLIHSDSLDELERRLVEAKIGMEQLRNEIRERHLRWTRIEVLLGLKLRNNMGLQRVQELLNSTVANARTFAAEKMVVDHGTDFITSESREVKDVLTLQEDQMQPPFQLKRKEVGCLPSRSSFSKSQVPRNYSFVRPFAAIWRKKVGSHSSASSQTSH